jgi:hypothetical protein
VLELHPRRLHHRLQLAHPLTLQVDGFVSEKQALALGLFLGNHFSQTLVDLRLPLTEALLRLRQLQRLDLDGMRLVLQNAQLLPRLVHSVLRIGQATFDITEARLRVRHRFVPLSDHRRQRVNLALTFEQAVRRTVRRKQRHTLPADDVAAGGHAASVRCQLAAARQSRSQIGSSQHVAQPVGKNRRQGRIVAANSRQQPLVGRPPAAGSRQPGAATRSACRPGGPCSTPGRRVLPAERTAVRAGSLRPHLPNRLRRAGFPQRLALLQPVPAQPFVELAVGLQALLQLLQRHPTSVGLGTFLLCVLNFRQHFPPSLFQTRQLLLLAL